MFLGGVVAAVAVENATTYWSTKLLIDRTGAGAGIAAAATAGLVAGMTAIRLIVGPLSLRVTPAHLLVGGFLFNIVGWTVLWTTTSTGVALAGLVLSGFGVGVQYPLSIALLLAASPGHSDRAQGDATLWGAVSIGIAPFLLGWLSDQVGMHTAFLAVPVFALLGAVVAMLGGRALRRQEA
jgi:fucose permease